MAKSAKAYRAELRQTGVFYTPPALAEMAKTLLGDKPITEVYDPTCGIGALLTVFDDTVKKYGQELDIESLKIAQDTIVNFTGYAGDTLVDDKFINQTFDYIVANPPFSCSWTPDVHDVRFKDVEKTAPKSKADWAFIQHCLHHLGKGKAVIIAFPGVLYRGGAEGTIRKWFIDNNYIEKIVRIPKDTFEDTSIETTIIVLNKHKTTTDVVFSSEGKEKIIPVDKIIKEDYTLSYNLYMTEHKEEKIIDIAFESECIQLYLLHSFVKLLRLNDLICETVKSSPGVFKASVMLILGRDLKELNVPDIFDETLGYARVAPTPGYESIFFERIDKGEDSNKIIRELFREYLFQNLKEKK